MKALVTQLYSIPFYQEKSAFTLNEKENKFISKIVYGESVGRKGVKISENTDILEDKNLKRLKNFFDKRAGIYVKDVLQIRDKVFMINSWCAKSDKNSSHHTHTHNGAFISLVFYVQCNSGKLIINEDRSSIQSAYNFDYDVKKFNPFNTPRYFFEVKTGDLVIFPGHLRHGTEKNEDNIDRVIIGANYFLKGVIGKKKRITYINE